MNKVILMGRLVADPEFSMSASGMPYCRFRIAVDRSYAKQGEERQSDFFRITVFGKTAEHVNRYFVKGKPILVEGEVHNDNYTDKNGVQHYSVDIIANNVHFLLSDPTRTANGNGNYNNNYGNYNNNNYGNNNGNYNNNNYGNNNGNYNNNNYNNRNNYNDNNYNQNDNYYNQSDFRNDPPPPSKDVQLGSEGGSDFKDFEQIISDGDLPF